MKKTIILTLSICLFTIGIASAQVIPNFSFGVKGGLNYSNFPSNGIFNNSNRAGYLAGVWARVGGLGLNFQPELYVTGKNINVKADNTSVENKAKFTSIDVPLLLGGKIGAFGLGGRFYAGPLLSFAINKDNSFGSAVGGATRFDYKSSNFALTAGAGIDISKISIDLRYEAGLTKQNYFDGSTNYKTRVSLFNLSLGYAFL